MCSVDVGWQFVVAGEVVVDTGGILRSWLGDHRRS
jgi:hypothetical protein